MVERCHPTAPTFRLRPPAADCLCLMAALAGLLGSPARGQFDDPAEEILSQARPASRPAEVTAASRPEPADAAPAKAPARARQGTIILSDGTELQGQIWTTLEKPLRVWDAAAKRYQDIDLALVDRAEAVVDEEKMEDDWRWLKEGSDVKIYSGKKYPNVVLHYRFTLINRQESEGPVVAPIYFSDGKKIRTLALYAKYKGKLDETLKDLVYIRSLSLTGGDSAASAPRTTKLPLIED